MVDRKIKEELEREVEVPESIRKRVKYILDDIRLSEFGNNEKETNFQKRGKQKRFYGKSVAAAACLLLASSITVTAAVAKWTPDFMQRFQISENLQEKMEEEGINYTSLETIEQNGMSISLEQCLTDNEYFYCLFKVVLPEGVTDGQFEYLDVEGYKREDCIESSGTHCYRVTEEDGEKNIFYYVLSGKHSTLETTDGGEGIGETSKVVSKSCVTEEDYKTGHMTFCFENFGVYDKENQFQPSVTGIWEFQWAEKKVEDKNKKEYAINRKVGKGYYARNNAILNQVNVSPITISLVYEIPDCPEDKLQLVYYPAEATEVELKDGTRVDLIQIDSGFEDYYDEENKKFRYVYGLNPVTDPQEITAIYFGDNERIQLQ
ncbi:MAG: DUF4179 domain-containing protein [Lachnospiraceae bacterium]|nr:DUF4179 domain-containing protein [Lachnospiraceae bacterium]